MKTEEEVENRIQFIEQGIEVIKRDLNTANGAGSYAVVKDCARKILLREQLVSELRWVLESQGVDR